MSLSRQSAFAYCVLLAVADYCGCNWLDRLCWCRELPVIRSRRTQATNRRSSASSLRGSGVENISSRHRRHRWQKSVATSSSAHRPPSMTEPEVSWQLSWYYTVSQKTCDYIFYNNFNNKCPITVIFGIVSSQSRRHRKMVSFPTSPI